MMPRVKVCGVRRVEDARLACALGADAIGMVFWPGSPRFLEPAAARAIVEALPPFVTPVGIFVDQTPKEVAAIASLLGLGAVQLHGDEPVEAYTATPARVIKAVAVHARFDPVQACRDLPQAATLLLDAADPIRRGGTGRTVDWSVAAVAAGLRPTILSGGLTAVNVAAAVHRVRPYAVDVSSGVEAAPGIKDPARLRAFFAALAAVSVHS